MPKLHYFTSCAYSALQAENKESHSVQTVPSSHGAWENYYARHWQHDSHIAVHHACPNAGLQAFDLFLQDGMILEESPRTTQTLHPNFSAVWPNSSSDTMPTSMPSPLCSLYSPSRITQPYIRRTLYDAWKDNLENTTGPIDAWARLQDKKTKNTAYQKERVRGDFVRLSWEDANTIIAAAILHNCIAHGPQSILGYTCGYTKDMKQANKSMIDMAAYAAGSRFLHLLGARFLACSIDHMQTGLRIISQASDWNNLQVYDDKDVFLQTYSPSVRPTNSQKSVLFAWHTGGQHFSEDTRPFALIVHADKALHAASLHADIILPASHAYECDELHFTDKGSFLYASSAVQSAPWASRDYWQQFAAIAKKISALSREEAKNNEQNQWADIYSKLSTLGPCITQTNSIKANGMAWDCAHEYEMLRSCLGVVHDNTFTKGMPHIKNAKDACNCILALSPESNGVLNERLWAAVKKEHRPQALPIVRASYNSHMTFRMLSQQPQKTLQCPNAVAKTDIVSPTTPSFHSHFDALAKPQAEAQPLASFTQAHDTVHQEYAKIINKDDRQALLTMAALLRYPDQELWDLWNNIIDKNSRLSKHNTALAHCIQSIKKQSLADMQAAYVNTFELRQDCTLHMAWHRYGDSPQRHHAYAALHALYRDAGFEPQGFIPTLPDYLPKILEFSAHAPHWAVHSIRQAFGYELCTLHNNVQNIQSPYADLLGLAATYLALDE